MIALMTEADWARARHFSPEEHWGDHLRMKREFIFLLDDIREAYKHPMHIFCGLDAPTVGGHTSNTRHYVYDPETHLYYADAADFSVDGIDYKDAVDLIQDFLHSLGYFYRVGLGIYPGYAHPTMHLDLRGVFKRWGWIGQRDRNGNMVYTTFEVAYRSIR